MAQQDLYSATTGSMVAQTLQDILARRRDAARQQIIDRLTVEEHKNTQREREAQSRRADEALTLQKLAEARQKQLTEAQLEESTENLMRSRMLGLPMGSTPDQIPDTRLRQYLQQIGKMPEQLVEGPTEEGGQLPPVRSFVGTYEQQEKAADRARQAQAIEDMRAAAGKDITPGQEAALAGLGAGLNVNPSFFESATVDVPMIGPTGKILPSVKTPRGVDPIRLGFQPSVPAAALPKIHQVFDKSGALLGSIPLRAEEIAAWQVENPDKILRPEAFQAKAVGPVPAQLLNALRDSRVIYESTPSGVFGEGRNKKAARAGYEAALGTVYGRDPASLEMKEVAKAIALNPKLSKLSVSQVIQDPKFLKMTEGTLDDDQLVELDRLLNYHLGIKIE
mgnify:CR=1 FL=1